MLSNECNRLGGVAIRTVSVPPSINGTINVTGDDQGLATILRPFYTQFLSDLSLKQPFILHEPDKLMKAVLEYAGGTGVPFPPNSHSFSCLMVGYSYSGNCIPYHPFDVKVWLAIITWLTALCDDPERYGTIQDIQGFQERWLMGKKQPTILTQTFDDQLRLAYQYYEPLVANLIISRTFEFLTSNALTARKPVTVPSQGGQNFPWWVRDKDGMGEAYAWFTFPKEKYPDMTVPVEAIHDMAKCLSLVNDVLSFYKEEMNGETDTYIHSKAAFAGIDVITSLKETAKEAIECAQRIEQVLEGKGEYQKAWQQHSTGYVEMHLMRGRYRLWEVGIGYRPESTEILK